MQRHDWVPVRTGLEEPHREPAGSPVARLLEGQLKKLNRMQAFTEQERIALWPASFFGLDRVRYFAEASAELQAEVIGRCSGDLVIESYFVEKSALSYCAKMILLAETTEIKQVYSHIAADEATHLQWVTPYVEEQERTSGGGPFLQFVSSLVEQCDANTLAYLVQVILEGWGLHHYASLWKHCLDPNVARLFQQLHRDEAMHHHAGEIVFNAMKVSKDQRNFIIDSLCTYAEFVRVGPQGVVTCLEHSLGGFNQDQRSQVFKELEAEITSADKLKMLRSLMLAPGMERYVEAVEERGGFIPLDARSCAMLHARQIAKSPSPHPNRRSASAV